MKGLSVECPGCGTAIDRNFLNSHLDSGCKSRAQSQAKLSFGKIGSSSQEKTRESFVRKRHEDEPQDEKPAKRRKTQKEAILASQPLAERMRPADLESFVGQRNLLGKGALLRTLIEKDAFQSFVLWGPPASGKTTIARIIAKTTTSVFREVSATSASTADLRRIFDDAQNLLRLTGQKTIVGVFRILGAKLFVDECQRFSKAIQDLFLPVIEAGTISCILATTENPSFRLQSALLSRCRVFVLEKHSADDILIMLKRGLSHLQDGKAELSLIDDDLLTFLSTASDGDARVALSSLQMAFEAVNNGSTITKEELRDSLRKAHLMYDRTGDQHYNTISALHKSVRGGDADAALYWLARMLEAGDDPLYIARRVVRMASEDIGSADPTALPLAVAAYQAASLVGMPECDAVLAQAVVHLAEAPKSIRVYRAYNEAKEVVRKEPSYPVPLHLRNAPTGLMRDLDYGKDYRYNPDFAHPIVQSYFPPELERRIFLGNDRGNTIDEELLAEWEQKRNGGLPWSGRS